MALRVALSRLVFVLSLISFAAMAISDCNYEVSVKTGDVPKAQAQHSVKLQLVSCTRKNFTIADLRKLSPKPPDALFKKGQVDTFRFSKTCLDVCAMIITHDAGDAKIYSGWYLESVNVTTGDGSSPMQFSVYRWLANDEPPNQPFAKVNSCNCLVDLNSASSSESGSSSESEEVASPISSE